MITKIQWQYWKGGEDEPQFFQVRDRLFVPAAWAPRQINAFMEGYENEGAL